MIVTSFPVAAQPFILNQVIGLLTRGHDVDIYALCDTRHELSHPDVDRYDLQSRVTYLNIPATVRARCRECLKGFSFSSLRSLWAIRGLGWGVLTLRFSIFLKKLRCHDYDVFYAHYLHNADYAAAARLAGMAKLAVVEGHGTVFVTEASSAAVKRLSRWMDHMVTVSRDLQERLAHRGVPGRKIAVIHTGINLDRFSFDGSQSSSPNSCRLLCIGRLVPVKGHVYAVKVLAELRAREVDARLTLVGGGPCRGDLVREAESLGVASYLECIDLISQDRVVEYYRNSTILLHPSVTLESGSAEGIPNAVKEAMAVGLPVVAFDSGGISELVVDGQTGILVEEKDVPGLADAVCSLIDDEKLRKRLVEDGRREIKREYSQQGVVKELDSLLRELVTTEGTDRTDGD